MLPTSTTSKQSLLDYIQRTYGEWGARGSDRPSLTCRTSLLRRLTATSSCSSYEEGWETFVDELLAVTGLPSSNRMDNLPGVVLYLRIVSSIHDEIADPLLIRQGNEAKRSNELKDLIRERHMRKIASSWQDLLAQYGNQNDLVVEMTAEGHRQVGQLDRYLTGYQPRYAQPSAAHRRKDKPRREGRQGPGCAQSIPSRI